MKQWQFLMIAYAIAALGGYDRRVAAAASAPRRDANRASASRATERRRTSGAGAHGGHRDPASGDAPALARFEAARGRRADSPSEIPKQGWRDVLLRVKQQVGEDNVSLTAAGVAFRWLFAVFPLLGSMIAIYGIVADPSEVQRQVEGLLGLLSPAVVDILHDQLTKLTEKSNAALGFGAMFGILFSLWSANAGTGAMVTALNIVNSEREKRGFVRRTAVTLTLTLATVLAAVGALLLMVVLPVVFRVVGLEETVRTWLALLRWPLLAIAFMFGLAVLYRYAPSREKPRWRWVTWGSALATVLWLIASGGFAIYVANFANYDETYGSLGAVIVLMMWFFITAFIILLGAELNAELEHQTAKDSTAHGPRPMGLRGAHMADTLGKRS